MLSNHRHHFSDMFVSETKAEFTLNILLQAYTYTCRLRDETKAEFTVNILLQFLTLTLSKTTTPKKMAPSLLSVTKNFFFIFK